MTPHLALIGPTASGKTDVALAVAASLGDVEIVSVDSMQVYRGMDIGTAKLAAEARAGVPHHLIDMVDPVDEWSVACFQTAAREVVAGIEGRGRRALFVGGTGLYVRAVVDGLELAGGDAVIRAELEEASATADGLAGLYVELVGVDPVAAARIDRANRRRIVRALEVIRATGRPFSSFGTGLSTYAPSPISLVGLWLTRPALAARVRERVRGMFAAGFVDEVRALTGGVAPGRALSRTAAEAIGYREVLRELRRPVADLDAAADATGRRTLAFARRQRVWFRRDPRVRWLGTAGNSTAVVPALLALWSR